VVPVRGRAGAEFAAPRSLTRHRLRDVAEALLAVFARPRALWTVPSGSAVPIAVLPVLFHLLWCGDLDLNLSVPLHEGTRVHATRVHPAGTRR
jgi:hypothetical protein